MAEQRYRAVLAVIGEGQTVKDVAAQGRAQPPSIPVRFTATPYTATSRPKPWQPPNADNH